MEANKIICLKPTKTLTKNKEYLGAPVRKTDSDGSYNGAWTTSWMDCDITTCTSFRVQDDLNITRYISNKRFSYGK